ncbi:hypothetical protein [Bradyrhizobium elkanii]|uniref:hypothetical protein n=1 Tax=Bradyrhizobium elkanii TaxID=29448 RepID=UPI00272C2B8C|nr:hypothetical protein [Bradyrhizobium elkanii]WLA80280.1 hypothetical protein QNJ99_33580 [Bradyrhizobium elkanii]
MAEGYIPRSKVKQYGIDDLGLFGDQLDFFMRVIRRADDMYLSSKSAKSSDPKMLDEVSVKDGAGMRSLLHRLAAPKNIKDRFVKRTKPKDET